MYVQWMIFEQFDFGSVADSVISHKNGRGSPSALFPVQVGLLVRKQAGSRRLCERSIQSFSHVAHGFRTHPRLHSLEQLPFFFADVSRQSLAEGP